MNGDLEFAELVDRYYGSLYRFAFSLTQSEADACDLVQETFYIWARKGDQLRQGSRVKSWLFTALYREFLQSRRRRMRFPQVELSEAARELPAASGPGWNQLDGRQLVRLIHSIDEPFQAPLTLFYLEDFSYEEISQTLQLPLGTVKSRLSRGVAQLRRLLGGDIQTEKGTSHD